MKNQKRIIKGLLSIMLFSLNINVGHANNIEANTALSLTENQIYVAEHTIPVESLTIEEANRYSSDELPMPRNSSGNIESEMETWKESTVEYLENIHNQKIVDVIEDNEKVTFYYEVVSDYLNEQIESTQYFKTSSFSRASTGDTKIELYVAWSGTVNPLNVDIKTASNFLAAASIAISLAPGIGTIMSAVIAGVAAFTGWIIDSNLPIKVETKNAVKYYRKIGSYYLNTGVWWPSVQVGRAEYWYYITSYQATYSGGPLIPHHQDRIPNAAENNFNESANKTYYNNPDWIINKVIELANSGNVYIDIFG